MSEEGNIGSPLPQAPSMNLSFWHQPWYPKEYDILVWVCIWGINLVPAL